MFLLKNLAVTRRPCLWIALLLSLLAASIFLVLSCGKKSELPNVILISIDTLRSDHLGCYGYDRPTSPTIDSLAAEGILFRNTVTQSSWTLPSHVTLFSSTFPFTHGVIDDNSRIPQDLEMMAGILKSHGYRSGGAVSSFYVGRTYGFERGFDDFEDFGVGVYKQFFPGDKIQADAVTDWGLDWLSSASEPFFLFLHYYDAHVNYTVPEPYQSLFENADDKPAIIYESYDHYKTYPPSSMAKSHILAQYDAAIAYVDANIRRLLRTLEATGVAEQTLLVVTSDHGEEFFEHGSWGHGESLYEQLLRVPLLIVDPRREASGLKISHGARLIDVLPTLLDALGLPAAGGQQGQSLWPLVTGSASVGDGLNLSETSRYTVNLVSLTKGPLKLIANLRDDRQEIFNLEEDPGEQANLSLADTALTRNLVDETVMISGGLVPSRLRIRWQNDSQDHRYSGELTTAGAVVDASYEGGVGGSILVSRDHHTVTFASDRAGEIRVAVLALDASITLDLKIDGARARDRVFIGDAATQPGDMPFTFSGIVHSPGLLRPPPDRGAGFYVWKDPGDRMTVEPVDLSEEAKEHLKSLGYLH